MDLLYSYTNIICLIKAFVKSIFYADLNAERAETML